MNISGISGHVAILYHVELEPSSHYNLLPMTQNLSTPYRPYNQMSIADDSRIVTGINFTWNL